MTDADALARIRAALLTGAYPRVSGPWAGDNDFVVVRFDLAGQVVVAVRQDAHGQSPRWAVEVHRRSGIDPAQLYAHDRGDGDRSCPRCGRESDYLGRLLRYDPDDACRWRSQTGAMAAADEALRAVGWVLDLAPPDEESEEVVASGEGELPPRTFGSSYKENLP